MNACNDNEIKKNEYKNTSNIFEQVLQEIFSDSIDLKDAYVLKINKKDTGLIINFLKENNLNQDKVFLKSLSGDSNSYDKNSINLSTDTDFKYGKFSINFNMHNKNSKNLYDISFLKRVKSINDNENLILIAFLDVIYY
jgi:hypothetical protein